MNKYIFLLTTILLFFSCEEENKRSNKVSEISEEKELNSETGNEDVEKLFGINFPQKWILVEMSTMLANSQTSGENMEYQESYIFSADQNFTKHRQLGNHSIYSGGNYSIVESSAGEKMVKLSHDSITELVENCSGDNLEFLMITSEKTLQATANACDHPSKKYEPENN